MATRAISRVTTRALSAVIVTHNSAAVVGRCLASLKIHLPGSEVIIVDNASTDETLTSTGGVIPTVTICNSVNVGYGRACNQGAEAATGSHVVFLNPDVTVTGIDLARLENELAERPFGLRGAFFCDGTRIAPVIKPDRRWSIEVISHALGPLRPRELPAFPRVTLPHRAWWPAGAVLLCSRAEFLRIGGFKPSFFLYYEDRDLARRYRTAGMPVRATRSVVAAHTQGTSSASDDPLRTVAHGWAYLGWLEYLTVWYGEDTARKAMAYADRLTGAADRMLALLGWRGPLANRARRKRKQLRGIREFVLWQSADAAGTADAGFCPNARRIIASKGART